jgi:site-specific recombinase XerD
VFLASGARLSEVVGLALDDVDVRLGQLKVVGKGGRERYVPITRKAKIDLNRYMQHRLRHPFVRGRLTRGDEVTALWIGPKGPLTPSGAYQALRRRATRLGYDDAVHPHAFRHTFSHNYLTDGGNEHALAHLNGWSSTQMVARYAKATS